MAQNELFSDNYCYVIRWNYIVLLLWI